MRINIQTAQNSHQGVAIDVFAKEVEKRTDGPDEQAAFDKLSAADKQA